MSDYYLGKPRENTTIKVCLQLKIYKFKPVYQKKSARLEMAERERRMDLDLERGNENREEVAVALAR